MPVVQQNFANKTQKNSIFKVYRAEYDLYFHNMYVYYTISVKKNRKKKNIFALHCKDPNPHNFIHPSETGSIVDIFTNKFRIKIPG